MTRDDSKIEGFSSSATSRMRTAFEAAPFLERGVAHAKIILAERTILSICHS